MPPVKAGSAAEDRTLTLEPNTVVGEGVFECLDGEEVLVDEWLVGVVPEVLGGLQFGRVGGQEDQMQALGHLHQGTGVVAGLIEYQHNALARTSAHCPGEVL